MMGAPTGPIGDAEIARLAVLWRADEELAGLAHHTDVRFRLASAADTPPTWDLDVVFDGDGVHVGRWAGGGDDRVSHDGPAFAVVLPGAAWLDLTSASPTPGRQSVLAYLRPGEPGRIEGSEEAFAQHVHLVRRLVEVARPAPDPRDLPDVPEIDRSGIVGGYVAVTVEGWGRCDVHVERAGTGPPLVLLATAGADARQYHRLLCDEQLTSRFELLALDLPWHGRSSPPSGRHPTSYALDAHRYVEVVTATIAALGLDRPIVVGSSMAGAAVIEIAARAPEAISGAIGAQVGPRVANRRTAWLRHPRINQTLHVAEWTYALLSPHSPKTCRDEVWWGYSQGGYGVYDGDIAYYTRDWDIDGVEGLLDGSVPIVLLSGAYDTSVPPSATRELAARIPGAVLRVMPELGHFPHAENPPVFREHLLWAIEQIRRSSSPHR